MRGGYLHNEILIMQLASDFEDRGGTVAVEVPARLGTQILFSDLVVDIAGHRIAVEAELSTKRVGRDRTKARAIGADQLWIIVSTAILARAVNRQLSRSRQVDQHPDVLVLTLGAARQRIARCFPLISGSLGGEKTEKQNQKESK